MSELKAYKGDVTIPVYGTIADAEVYLKEEADEILDNIKYSRDEWAKACNQRDKEIAELKATERRLRRALWLQRADRAFGWGLYWCARFTNESGFTKADIIGYSVKTPRKLRMIRDWMKIWQNVEAKCRAMAERYWEGK